MSRPTPTATPSRTHPPTFTLSQVKKALLKRADYGSTWSPASGDERRTSLREKKIETCARGAVEIPGEPSLITQQFGDKKRLVNGANHAQLILLYPTAEGASDAFDKVKEKLENCRPKQLVTRSPLPSSTLFTFEFDATWTPNDKPLGEWTRIGGFQKADFADSLSDFNVVYTAFDYAVRGNVLLTSLYWRGIEPKKSGAPVAKAAEEVLRKQLERIG